MSALKNLTVVIIPSELKVRERFQQALSTMFEDARDIEMISNAIGGYAELPNIVDTVSDEHRKAFKMTCNGKTRDFLRNNKLHRNMIAHVVLLTDMYDLIEESDSELVNKMKDIESTVKITNRTSIYNQWSNEERLSFVNEKVAPFAIEVCEKFIARSAQ